MSKHKVVCNEKEYYIDERKPSLIDLLPCDLRSKTTHEKIRWLIQFPFGYKVYTLRKKVPAGTEEIAYCFVSRAGNYRYPFAKKGDVIVGPYYVAPEHRGCHFAARLIAQCLKCFPNQIVWDFIESENKASIITSEKAGFQYVGDAKYSKWLRILQPCASGDKGEMRLYKQIGFKETCI